MSNIPCEMQGTRRGGAGTAGNHTSFLRMRETVASRASQHGGRTFGKECCLECHKPHAKNSVAVRNGTGEKKLFLHGEEK